MILLCDADWSAIRIAAHLGCCGQTVCDLIRDFLTGGNEALQPFRSGLTCSPQAEPADMRVTLAREGRRTFDQAHPPLARADHPQAPPGPVGWRGAERRGDSLRGDGRPGWGHLRDASRKLQDACYAAGPPVDRWQAVADETRAQAVLGEVVRRTVQRSEAAATLAGAGGRIIPWSVSLLAAAVPGGTALAGRYVLLRNLMLGQFGSGCELLGVVAALTVLVCIVLHALVSIFDPARRTSSARDLTRQVLSELVERTVRDWVIAYRTDLEADILDLREPVATFRSALDAPRVAGPVVAPLAERLTPSAVEATPLRESAIESSPPPDFRPSVPNSPEATPPGGAKCLLWALRGRSPSWHPH